MAVFVGLQLSNRLIDWNRLSDISVSLEGALLEETQYVDAVLSNRPPSFRREAKLKVGAELAEGERDNLSQAEEAILVLARAGVTVGHVMEVIPESRALVSRALGRMIELDLIVIE